MAMSILGRAPNNRCAIRLARVIDESRCGPFVGAIENEVGADSEKIVLEVELLILSLSLIRYHVAHKLPEILDDHGA
eukprot:CAMPEP_0118988750 /NCGR_PEP_ID=MMETSP1173-20130426/46786_1 /TAXON_ID=1034831 /ORGANISM="Rhizochromulina marina cf, Strain CCMP1243" /LENGTH=76 /DNA_ID=CAMNT_0006939699 /DNA_START=355 /DNA_END=585 /DNA_ORIENTATION=+